MCLRLVLHISPVLYQVVDPPLSNSSGLPSDPSEKTDNRSIFLRVAHQSISNSNELYGGGPGPMVIVRNSDAANMSGMSKSRANFQQCEIARLSLEH
jgi:hypothetical protein